MQSKDCQLIKAQLEKSGRDVKLFYPRTVIAVVQSQADIVRDNYSGSVQ